MNNTHDVVIAGGGMVGASLALALAHVGLSVAVVETRPPDGDEAGPPPSFDDRSTALSNGTRRILEGLGAWSDVAAAATSIAGIHVSESGRFGVTRIRAADEGVPALGHVLLNRELGALLWRWLRGAGSVELLAPARVGALAPADARGREVSVETDAGTRTLRCSLLVAADGADSTVRSRLGIGMRRHDYKQSAVIANVATSVAHRNWAYERFAPAGPMALLPMPEGRCGLVWTVGSELADELVTADAERFLATFQAAFGSRLGRVDRLGRRASYPLALTRAAAVTADRAVVLGNAANSLHPVAGQGFNLGLRDVAVLAELLAEAARQHADFGSAELLAHYGRWRRNDQLKVVAFTDGLVRGFAPRRFPLPQLRSLGLLMFDVLPGAKATLARHSMGLAGRLPRLVRGLPLQ